MSEPRTSRPNCRTLKAAPRPLPKGLSGPRMSAIQLNRSKWVNGTELTYHFLAGAIWEWPEEQKAVVRKAFATWKSLGIGLEFREVSNPIKAKLRIGFLQGDGSWSYVGTELLHNAELDGRNMNFGWDLTDAWGWATALHEIGHAIGMPHEHQNPKAGLIWNEDAVYKHYEKPPNEWDREETYFNIIHKLAASEVVGSNWDPTSIMHYPFEPGLIASPQHYRDYGTPENVDLSANDIAWVRRFFPPLASAISVKAGETVQIASASGAQSDFLLEADQAREFVLQTSGPADTVIVLSEEVDGTIEQVAASDDSGSAQNATIKASLKPGRRYIARVRTNFAEQGSAVAFKFV
jgi:Astacin (Peptidase family M12A)